ncbi:EAL domain-containing protein [Halomonas sp. M5N1S17]|uniref:sensor domain-containing phosphodiesterase n=1 Tax=Halomonas alkalisoli TaxID=2907158 RepID=UPI001F205F06|nr:EAL domain-containing protein [Halomonas alkalisoli]MCE9663273.1 EAL domain-containing protein [Halomonas alkalisoli]
MEAGASNATEHPLVDISLGLDELAEASTEHALHEVLHAIRTHLGMEVAFISEFEAERRIFRFVDEEPAVPLLEVGGSGPLDESYCQRVVDGRLPEVIRDARQEPAALDLAATWEVPIGAHVSVPIRLRDGSVYGTMCCFARQPNATLNERDLVMMRVFADFVARQLEGQRKRKQRQKATEARIRHVLDHRRFHIVFQPMYDLADQHIAGYEALSRFVAEPIRSPDKWFEEAATVGLREELELAAIEMALEALPEIPDLVYLSLNASPATILTGRLAGLFRPYPLDRLMLEVTEHDVIDDYAGLFEALVEMRRQGLRLAIDDAGAGYASFRHILRLAPDVIKLDRSLTHGIDTRRDSRALAAALVGFTAETGSRLLAEGVETQAELEALRDIGVRKAQGYLLGRPGPLPA